MELGAINKKTQNYVYPKIANKNELYICPNCNKDLILVQGNIRVHHFRHKVCSTRPCLYYDCPTESQIHKDAKMLFKYLLENKKILIFKRHYTCCDKHKKFKILELSPESKVQLEHKFIYKSMDKIADVACLNNDEIYCIFEICHTHKTLNENRPEPWFEIDAKTLIQLNNANDTDKLIIPCMRGEQKCLECFEYNQNLEKNIQKAKEIFASWCKSDLKTNFGRDIYWNSNKTVDPLLSYPIVCNKINSIVNVWDEIWSGESENLNKFNVPTINELNNKNLQHIALVDIVLEHEGRPKYFIDICPLNKISNKKSHLLIKNGVENYLIIDPNWILKQKSIPKIIQCIRWLPFNSNK